MRNTQHDHKGVALALVCDGAPGNRGRGAALGPIPVTWNQPSVLARWNSRLDCIKTKGPRRARRDRCA